MGVAEEEIERPLKAGEPTTFATQASRQCLVRVPGAVQIGPRPAGDRAPGEGRWAHGLFPRS